MTAKTTVEDVKKDIADKVGIRDFNRIGLFYPPGKKTLKDRLAYVLSEPDVTNTGELYVKDLGKAG